MTELNERNGHAAAAVTHIFLARLERRLGEVTEADEQRLEQRIAVQRVLSCLLRVLFPTRPKHGGLVRFFHFSPFIEGDVLTAKISFARRKSAEACARATEVIWKFPKFH